MGSPTCSRRPLCQFPDLQVPLNGSQACCPRPFPAIRHSPGSLPEEEPLKATKYIQSLHALFYPANKPLEAVINAEAPPPDEIEANDILIDSDEETELVMAAVTRSMPQRLEQHIIVPVRKKYQYVRKKEMLASARKPLGQPIFDGPNAGSLFNTSMANPASRAMQRRRPNKVAMRLPLDLFTNLVDFYKMISVVEFWSPITIYFPCLFFSPISASSHGPLYS